jgi:hypothetical protein
VLLLCAIAAAASVRRLVVLMTGALAASPPAELDAVFFAKALLTEWHVSAGLAFALAIPLQLSSSVRRRVPRLHRWLGRTLIGVGLAAALTGFAMLARPVGGVMEVAAIAVFGSYFVGALLAGWGLARRGRMASHREWMIRAVSVVLGVAVTRPVMAVFFVVGRAAAIEPAPFFGPAFWIGFSAATAAGEWYVRRTRAA